MLMGILQVDSELTLFDRFRRAALHHMNQVATNAGYTTTTRLL